MMKTRHVTVVGTCLFMFAASGSVFAKSDALREAPVVPLPRASQLADNVVVTPQGSTAPATAPVQPVLVQPVAVQPVETAPRRTTVVHEERPHNYMTTIAVSALMGAVAGALVGGAIYYLGSQDHAARIGYWAAGGVLVGTGVGLVQLAVQESRADAVATRLPSDPVPTYRLALLNLRF